jgi:hypothetical protein
MTSYLQEIRFSLTILGVELYFILFVCPLIFLYSISILFVLLKYFKCYCCHSLMSGHILFSINHFIPSPVIVAWQMMLSFAIFLFSNIATLPP